MRPACWSTLSMNSRGPRSPAACSRWQGPSSPRATRTRTPSPSTPSAGSSTNSGVGILTLIYILDHSASLRAFTSRSLSPYRCFSAPFLPSSLPPSTSIRFIRYWSGCFPVSPDAERCGNRFPRSRDGVWLTCVCLFSHRRQGEAALGEQAADLHAAPHRGHGEGKRLFECLLIDMHCEVCLQKITTPHACPFMSTCWTAFYEQCILKIIYLVFSSSP